MSWRASGRSKSWWIDSNGRLEVRSAPILSEWDDEEEGDDPLDLLTDKQRFVIELRYGFADGFTYSQDEVAALMGVTRQMISKHEKSAIQRLRKHIAQGHKGRENPV